MARTTSAASLEEKIEKAEQLVVKTKKKYEDAVDELKVLMDKRDALKKDELIAAILKSNKNYDDILNFINESNEDQ